MRRNSECWGEGRDCWSEKLQQQWKQLYVGLFNSNATAAVELFSKSGDVDGHQGGGWQPLLAGLKLFAAVHWGHDVFGRLRKRQVNICSNTYNIIHDFKQISFTLILYFLIYIWLTKLFVRKLLSLLLSDCHYSKIKQEKRVGVRELQHLVSIPVRCEDENSGRENFEAIGFLFCVLRQVVCAAAGRGGAERGEQGGLCQQPTEWGSHLGCTLLGVPLAVPAGNSGAPDLHSNSGCFGAGQVM